MTRRAPILAAALALALAGCAVGPNYRERPPTPAAAASLRPTPATDPIGPLPDRWWSLYADPRLDALVAEALAHNSDLRVAAANLDRAVAVLREQRASLFPTTTTSASVVRARGGNFSSGSSAGGGTTTGTGTGGTGTGGTGTGGTGTGGTGGTGTAGGLTSTNYDPTTILRGGFNLSYEVDLFGRIRRGIEAARADVAATEATRDATRVTVAAATTQAYFDGCLLGARVDVARRGLAILDATLQGVRRQVALGVGSPYDIARQDVQVQAQAAVVRQLEGLREQALYDLARLVGRPANDVPAAAIACRQAPRLARPIPVGDGRLLLARRPDVRQAERALAADTARIGVATANLFPTISLGGSVQAAGTSLGKAFQRNGVSYSFGPFLSWSFPNILAARAQIQQASAQARASLATFDGTVLTALNEVARALAGYDAEIRRNEALNRAVAASRQALRIAQARVRLGSISQLELIQVQNDLVTSEANLAESDATLGTNQVLLFRALGGGWQDAPAVDPTPRALAPAAAR